jgi:hypothetical protein
MRAWPQREGKFTRKKKGENEDGGNREKEDVCGASHACESQHK